MARRCARLREAATYQPNCKAARSTTTRAIGMEHVAAGEGGGVEAKLPSNVDLDQHQSEEECRISNWPNCRITTLLLHTRVA